MTGRGIGEPRLSPRRVAAKLKQAKAAELRSQGLTWAEVAEKAGYSSEGAAIRAADTILKQMPPADDRERWVAREAVRLEVAFQALGPRIMQGDDQAIRTAVAIMQRLSKLLGLDAPEEIILGGGGEPIRVEVLDTLDAAGQELARQLRDRVTAQRELRSGDPVIEGEAEE